MSAVELQPYKQHHRDRVRAEPIREIEVECAVAHQILPGGYLVAEGMNRLEVCESDIPGIMALVADASSGASVDEGAEVVTDPTAIERAHARLKEARDTFLAAMRERSGNPELTWKQVRQKASESGIPFSWQALYYADNFPVGTEGTPKAIAPLRSVKVLSGPKTPPLSVEERRSHLQNKDLIEGLTQALIQALGATGSKRSK